MERPPHVVAEADASIDSPTELHPLNFMFQPLSALFKIVAVDDVIVQGDLISVDTHIVGLVVSVDYEKMVMRLHLFGETYISPTGRRIEVLCYPLGDDK